MVEPTFNFFMGYNKFNRSVIENVELNIPQAVQAHFLKYDFYIPLENIFSANDEQSNEKHLVVSHLCAGGQIVVWVDLPIRMPYWHSVSYQGCFKII